MRGSTQTQRPVNRPEMWKKNKTNPACALMKQMGTQLLIGLYELAFFSPLSLFFMWQATPPACLNSSDAPPEQTATFVPLITAICREAAAEQSRADGGQSAQRVSIVGPAAGRGKRDSRPIGGLRSGGGGGSESLVEHRVATLNYFFLLLRQRKPGAAESISPA